eukprot:TRINITY_DN5247_c0_g1_i2.p1 TRINITY_DN5247_c0_g1~~TRINITY_DN5247_c0_g1_i2.p1  ORF type:complete len:237 (-),score=32.89 TRINITY_DN5247_c0_g1_i2:269-895(-)
MSRCVVAFLLFAGSLAELVPVGSDGVAQEKEEVIVQADGGIEDFTAGAAPGVPPAEPTSNNTAGKGIEDFTAGAAPGVPPAEPTSNKTAGKGARKDNSTKKRKDKGKPQTSTKKRKRKGKAQNSTKKGKGTKSKGKGKGKSMNGKGKTGKGSSGKGKGKGKGITTRLASKLRLIGRRGLVLFALPFLAMFVICRRSAAVREALYHFFP